MCIHDNFVYVQQVIKDLHKKKFQPSSLNWISQRSLILSVGPISLILCNFGDLGRDGENGLPLYGVQSYPLTCLMVTHAKECFIAEG
jgi:hypothetical protein